MKIVVMESDLKTILCHNITFIDHKIDLHGVEELLLDILEVSTMTKLQKLDYLHKTMSSLIGVSSHTEKYFKIIQFFLSRKFLNIFCRHKHFMLKVVLLLYFPQKLPIEE